MAKADILTPEYLRQILDYDPATGRLSWKARTASMFNDGARSAEWLCRQWNSWRAGKDALTTVSSGGYLTGHIGPAHVKAHRVAWAIVHGVWPAADIDHIDGDRKNNRLQNLREVDRLSNTRNRKLQRNNITGVPGLSRTHKGKPWQLAIADGGKLRYLGRFDTVEEAAAARKEAERELGYHPNHGRRS